MVVLRNPMLLACFLVVFVDFVMFSYGCLMCFYDIVSSCLSYVLLWFLLELSRFCYGCALYTGIALHRGDSYIGIPYCIEGPPI